MLRLWHAAADDVKERERRKLANASYLLGRDLMQRGDHLNALPLLEQAVEHDGSDHNKHYRLGKAQRLTRRPTEAILSLRRALDIKPRTAYVEVELAVALADAGESVEAERLLGRLSNHCRGWDAYKGGKLAGRLEQPGAGGRAARAGRARSDDAQRVMRPRRACGGAGGGPGSSPPQRGCKHSPE